jgi:hypothetical protein
MSDTTPPAQPEPTPPSSGYSAGSAGAPYASQPAGATGPKQGLSLTSFITGIAGVLLSAVPVLGFLAALAAVIIGFIAKGKEPAAPKWMWMVGIITGFVGILLSIIFTVLLVLPFLIFGAALNDYSY